MIQLFKTSAKRLTLLSKSPFGVMFDERRTLSIKKKIRQLGGKFYCPIVGQNYCPLTRGHLGKAEPGILPVKTWSGLFSTEPLDVTHPTISLFQCHHWCRQHELHILLPVRSNPPPIAQLDRAPGFEPGCREFESLWAGHFSPSLTINRLNRLQRIRLLPALQ